MVIQLLENHQNESLSSATIFMRSGLRGLLLSCPRLAHWWPLTGARGLAHPWLPKKPPGTFVVLGIPIYIFPRPDPAGVSNQMGSLPEEGWLAVGATPGRW